MNDLDTAIRELGAELFTPFSATKLLQGVVVSNEGWTCTVRIGSSSATPIAGFRMLLDAANCQPNDVVMVLDGGPGQRFCLGTTNRATSLPRAQWPVHHTVHCIWDGVVTSTWVHSPLFTSGLEVQQSEAGITTSTMTWYIPLMQGTYNVDALVLKASNAGNVAIDVDGTQIGTYDGYAGTSAGALVTGLSCVISWPHFVAVTVRKLGTKNASSSNYRALPSKIYFSRTAV